MRSAFVVIALVACTGTRTAPSRCLALGSSGYRVDVPSNLHVETSHDEPGYVNVIIGEAGRDPCAVGIEIYLAASADRPRDLAALQQSVEHDHAKQFVATDPAHVVQRDGRPTVTAAFESHENSLRQRQWAFMLGTDPVVVSAYTMQTLANCSPLESAVLSSIARGACPAH